MPEIKPIQYYSITVCKRDVINMLKGVSPGIMQPYLDLKLGSYDDNRGWSWNIYELEKLDVNTLLSYYIDCRDSWGNNEVYHQNLI